MAITHIKPGQDFFGSEHSPAHRAFGFTDSLGRADAKNHPPDPSGEEDGATYVERRAKGGRGKPHEKEAAHHYALGGMVDGAPSGRPAMSQPPQGAPTGGLMQNATISMPAADMAQAAAHMAAVGRHVGAAQAVNGLANAARARLAGGVPGQARAIAAAPQPAPAQQGVPAMAKGGRLTAAERRGLPEKDFALPGERYPINDPAHARAALSRASANASPAEQTAIRRKVHAKFPGIKQKG